MNDLEILVVDYNREQNKVFGLYTDPKYTLTYSPEHLQKLKADEHKKITESFKVKASQLVDSANYKHKEKTRLRSSKLFPLRFDSDIQKNILAEMKFQRAKDFLNITKEYSLIENEIKQALEFGETDYFNSLIDLVLLREDPLKPNISGNEAKFYSNVHKISDAYRQEIGIDKFDTEIKEADRLRRQASGFLKALNSQLIAYYPESTVKNMEQKDVHKHIVDIDKSTPFWQ